MSICWIIEIIFLSFSYFTCILLSEYRTVSTNFQSLEFLTLLITKFLLICCNPFLLITLRNIIPILWKKYYPEKRNAENGRKTNKCYIFVDSVITYSRIWIIRLGNCLQFCKFWNSADLLSIWTKFWMFANQQQNHANTRKGSPFNIECSRIYDGGVC